MLDSIQRHQQRGSTRSVQLPADVRAPANGKLPTGSSSSDSRQPRRHDRRMVPIPSNRDGHAVLRGKSRPLDRTHQKECTNLPKHSKSNMPDSESVLKRARHLNLPGNGTGIELQTSLENQPGGVNSSHANLFINLQPNADLSSTDIMHNSTSHACDVPVNDLINQELNTRDSSMNLSETDLPDATS